MYTSPAFMFEKESDISDLYLKIHPQTTLLLWHVLDSCGATSCVMDVICFTQKITFFAGGCS